MGLTGGVLSLDGRRWKFRIQRHDDKNSRGAAPTTTNVSSNGNVRNSTQCWLKLRKRKMSSVSYPAHHSSTTSNHLPHHNHHSSSSSSAGLTAAGPSPIAIVTAATPPSAQGSASDAATMVGLPSHIETLEQAVPSVPSRSCKSPECYDPEYNNMGKTQLQNSSTMDSGVEDCCEPPPVPSIELDDKLGFRVRVHMTKPEGTGFGFSVVWVSPPRIERLEKDKTADLAGLKIGDLIIGVNGEDVTTVPNTTIYNKMKSTGKELELEIWRKHPHVASPLPPHLTAANVPQPIHPACVQPPPPLQQSSLPPPPPSSKLSNGSADCRDHRPTNCSTALPQNNSYINNCINVKNTTSGLPSSSPAGMIQGNNNNPMRSIHHPQPPPPTSILKPPPPAPPVSAIVGNSCPSQSQPSTGSSSWRIRFNIELLDNEDDYLKQFFICELKFFRKVVAALDRYLIPAQANRLLTPQEIHLIFAQVIKIITMTKRILQCVANGSTSSTWKLGRILLSTHSDHLPEMTSAYTAYARSLGYSATILSEKMSIQDFAKFVLETTVPKGHLDMTSLLFAPFEHLRNLCEICEEISHHHDNWVFLNSRLKECYADIVCETDFMEPISHISMKKNPLVSVRDLEKRIISTTSQQALKVCEKGRKWLFGSRLYRRENDGSWSPVWAFLFTDIIVLTSHMTRDRVFFVKETPIRLDDVVTLHFNLPKKHENEFRLLFGPDTSHHSRLDRILPLVRSKKSNQVVLRTANVQLKSLWKLLLQRQIISLNTKLSKSSSSNFSISEFCEKFPVVQHDSIMEEDEEKGEVEGTPSTPAVTRAPLHQHRLAGQVTPNPSALQPHIRTATMTRPQQQNAGHAIQSKVAPSPSLIPDTVAVSTISKESQVPPSSEKHMEADERVSNETQPDRNAVTSPTIKPYIPDGLSIISKEVLRARVVRASGDRRPSIPPSVQTALDTEEKGYPSVQSPKVITRSTPSSANDRFAGNVAIYNEKSPESTSGLPASSSAKVSEMTTTKTDGVVPSSGGTAKVTSSGPIPARPTQHDVATSTPDNLYPTPSSFTVPPVPKARTSLSNAAHNTPTHGPGVSRTSTPGPESSSPSPVPSHNNNNTIDNVNHHEQKGGGEGKCPCEKLHERHHQPETGSGVGIIIRQDTKEHQPTAYPSPKPRQLSNLKRMSSREESTQTTGKQGYHPHQTNISRPSSDNITTAQGNRRTMAGISTDVIHNEGALQAGNDTEKKKAENNDDALLPPHGVATPPPAANATTTTVTPQSQNYSKESGILSKEQIPEALQSPLMVKRAQALASGTATPSSSSSLSPARMPSTTTKRNNNGISTEIQNEAMNNAYLKSKPGSRIMTNAILKSRQQELIAQSLQGNSASTETLRTEKSSDTTASTSKTDSSTQYFSLKEESTTTSSCSTQSNSQPQQIMVRCVHNKNIVVHHQHHSHHCPGSCAGNAMMMMAAAASGAGGTLAPGSPLLSVPPRCHSENSHHSKKSKPVHTDSPIISGYGSERARRRMIFDNKIRKDYPELFGITPKDRRSFIKQLGEKDLNSKGLVAPYYYTLSPVPTPKHMMMTMGNSSNDGSSISSNATRHPGSESDNGNKKPSPLVIPPFNPNSQVKDPIKSNEERGVVTTKGATTTTTGGTKDSSEMIVVSGITNNNKRTEQSAPSAGAPLAQPRSRDNTVPRDESNDNNDNMCRSSFQEGNGNTSIRGQSIVTPGIGVEAESRKGSGRVTDDEEDDASGIAAQIAHDVYQASLELDEEGQRLKDFVEKMREEMTVGGVGMEDDDDEEEDDDEDEEDDDEEDEDSDDSTAGGHEGERGQSHRSHEESSNDSGISDEMTEKSKTTMSGLLEEDEDHERSLSLSISRRNENFSNMLDRMRSSVLAAEVKNPTNPDKISTSTAVSNSTTPVANSTVHILDTNNPPVVDDDGNNVVDNCCSPNNDANKTQYASANHPSHCCTNNKAHVVDDTTLCFLEGETKASVETMVVLKADKATATEDDDFNFLLAMNNLRECSHATSHNAHHHHSQQKPLRSILAERREAFFLSQQSSFSSTNCPYTNNMSTATMSGHSIHFAEDSNYIHYSHHGNNCSACSASQCRGGVCGGGASGLACVNCSSDDPSSNQQQQQNRDPLIVKIVDGGTLHSVDAAGGVKQEPNTTDTACERVQLQRLERQKKAKVERVESSEDSTSSSSDLASASPAAENGTTDPSWSSSSSSLAGYASSKEDPLANNSNNLNNTNNVNINNNNNIASNGSSNSNNVEPAAAVAISTPASGSSPSSSSFISASTAVPTAAAAAVIVAPSASSQCSNNNINPDLNSSSGSSSSSSGPVNSRNNNSSSTGEPSSSYHSTSSKSYSLLLDNTSEPSKGSHDDPAAEEQQLISGQQTEDSTSASNSPSCSSRPSNGSHKHPSVGNVNAASANYDSHHNNNNTNSTTTRNSNIASSCSHQTSSPAASKIISSIKSSEMNQSFESSELDSSTSCSSISNTSGSSKVTLLTSSTNKSTTTSCSSSTTTTSSSYLSRSSGGGPPTSSARVVVVGGGFVVTPEDDDDPDDEIEVDVDDSDLLDPPHEEEEEEEEAGEERVARTGPEIVVTQESDPEDSSHSSNDNGNTRHGYSSDGEEDSIVCNGKAVDSVASDDNGGGSSAGEGGGSACSSNRSSTSKGFLRVESNDSTAENYGDDDDYNFDDEDDEDDLSHCSVATINRYGTFESLEKLESEDTVGGLPEFPGRSMPRSKARFTFEDDDDDDDDDLFEEDFESDFNFRFPSQIQDNTYSVSRLGPLPPLLEEDYEDDMYDEQRASGVSPSSSGIGEFSGGVVGPSSGGCSSSAASLRSRHEVSTMAIQRVSASTDPTSLEPSASASSSASSPLSSRSQKVVLITSPEVIVIAEAAARDTEASSRSPEKVGGKPSSMSSSTKIDTVVASKTTTASMHTTSPTAGTSAANVASNTTTNTSI